MSSIAVDYDSLYPPTMFRTYEWVQHPEHEQVGYLKPIGMWTTVDGDGETVIYRPQWIGDDGEQYV